MKSFKLSCVIFKYFEVKSCIQNLRAGMLNIRSKKKKSSTGLNATTTKKYK